MSRAGAEDAALDMLLKQLMTLAQDEDEIRFFLRGLTVPELRRLERAWALWAHRGQKPPQGAWRVWLMLAGRGFGKTRAGAEWVSQLARADGSLRIALVGGTIDEVANVMIHGQSGLMAVAPLEEGQLQWVPSTRTLTFPNGALAFAYSGERPDKLRGPEHHIAWCDELAKWGHPQETWDNLMLGLRLGQRPRVLVTTTPRPISLVRKLAGDPKTAGTKVPGRTRDNPHLSEIFVADVRERYGGTRLGRQELDGELIGDVEGALWTRDLVERCRHRPHPNPSLKGRGFL